jgi:hypothetical protein
MEACYGRTDVMEGSCAVARGKDINSKCGFDMKHQHAPTYYHSHTKDTQCPKAQWRARGIVQVKMKPYWLFQTPAKHGPKITRIGGPKINPGILEPASVNTSPASVKGTRQQSKDFAPF